MFASQQDNLPDREDDKWSERPFIYAKVYNTVLALIDTGCGGASSKPDVSLTSLREFIETFPVTDNDGQPLNADSIRDYVVICTHCHHDHIGAIEEFTISKSNIWASAFEKSFIEPQSHLERHSLCSSVGMKTPTYRVTNWAKDGDFVTEKDNKSLGLQIFHTPGHTPDELAIWDAAERVIYVGDTLYERVSIIFPKEGNLFDYSRTIGRLKTFVHDCNGRSDNVTMATSVLSRVKMASGHCTSGADAATLLGNVDRFILRVLKCSIEPNGSEIVRDEERQSFKSLDGELALLISVRLLDDFRNDNAAMDAIRRRQMGA